MKSKSIYVLQQIHMMSPLFGWSLIWLHQAYSVFVFACPFRFRGPLFLRLYPEFLPKDLSRGCA